MSLQASIEWLNQSTCALEGNDRSVVESAVCQLRAQFREKFFEICIVHLSHLIDLPTDFFVTAAKLADKSDRVTSPATPAKRNHTDLMTRLTNLIASPSASKCRQKSDYESESASFVALKRLIRYLDNDHKLQQEGIFRKTGNVSRVKQLKERLSLCGDQIPLSIFETDDAQCLADTPINSTPCRGAQSAQLFTVHDTVGTLKALLADFAEPLVTDDLFEVFCDVTMMCQPRADVHGHAVMASDEDLVLFEAKRRKAFRLLTLMLPLENRSILYSLLSLLYKTLQHVEHNKMTAEALGTVFAPLIVSPRTISPAEIGAQQKGRIIPTLVKMIEQGCESFKIPLDVAYDMKSYLHKLYDGEAIPVGELDENFQLTSNILLVDSPPRSTCDLSLSTFVESFSFPKTSSEAHDDALDTCVSFATQTRSIGPSIDHDQVIAQLFAQVEALPDSKQKSKYLTKLRRYHGTAEDAPTSFSGQLTKSSKRKYFTTFLNKIRRTDDKNQDQENKENSQVHRMEMNHSQERNSKSYSAIESESFEPNNLFAMRVPPKMDKSACRYLSDVSEQSSCDWPTAQKTFIKKNKC